MHRNNPPKTPKVPFPSPPPPSPPPPTHPARPRFHRQTRQGNRAYKLSAAAQDAACQSPLLHKYPTIRRYRVLSTCEGVAADHVMYSPPLPGAVSWHAVVSDRPALAARPVCWMRRDGMGWDGVGLRLLSLVVRSGSMPKRAAALCMLTCLETPTKTRSSYTFIIQPSTLHQSYSYHTTTNIALYQPTYTLPSPVQKCT